MRPLRFLRRLRTAFRGDWTELADAFRSAAGPGYDPPRDYLAVSRDGYECDTWVNRCVRELSESVASVRWMAVDSASGRAVPDAHPAAMLLRAPSPSTDMAAPGPNAGVSWQKWAETWATYLLLGGVAYAERIESESVAPPELSLDLWQPDCVERLYDARDETTGYRVTRGGMHRVVRPEMMARWLLIHPRHPHRGLSVVAPAMSSIRNERLADRWLRALLDNAGIPSGVISLPADRKFSPRERKAFQDDLRRGFSGRNLYTPMVLQGGAKWDTISAKADDMQFSDMRTRNAREICAAAGVPPWQAGATEPKYENYRIARLALWQDSVIPLLDRLGDTLQALYRHYWPGILPKYDLSGTPAMIDSFHDRLDAAAKLRHLGYPLNAINRRLDLGMDDVDGGDAPLVWGNPVPLDLLADEMAAGAMRADTGDEPAMAAIRSETSVSSRHGAVNGHAALLAGARHSIQSGRTH